MGKLSSAQITLLHVLSQGNRRLVNCDECTPMWWVEGGPKCSTSTARTLAKTPYVQLVKHEGGWPGIDYFSITPAGRAALKGALQ